MDRRGTNTWLVAALAITVGFLAALLIFGRDDNSNSSAIVSQTGATTATNPATSETVTTPPTTTTAATTTTATATTPATPTTPAATTDSCINLWNGTNNRGNQVFLVNVMSQQAVRVHVGVTSSVPPKCLVTIVGNNGNAYVFPEGGGTTYPYAQSAGTTPSSSLPAGQKLSNALEQRDGTLAAR